MRLFVLFIVLAQVSRANTPAVEARGVLDAPEIPFHRTARYHVSVEGPAGAEFVVEPWPADQRPGLAVTAGAPTHSNAADGRTLFEQDFVLAPTGPRTYALPETAVLVDGSPAATLPALTLVVRDLTPEEKAVVAAPQELLTLAELRSPRAGPAWRYILVLPGAIALGVVGWILVRFGVPRLRAARVLSPAEVAAASLGRLREELDRDAIACESFYVALSGLLRDYIGASCGVAIHEQSTPEFVENTLGNLALDPEHADRLRALLVECDRVKFAQHLPGRECQFNAVEAVRLLVEAMERPASPEALADTRGAA